MAFTFPDPNVTTEFTGDNGITYSWDAVDGKWQVKTTAALDDIRQDIIELEEEIDAIAPSVCLLYTSPSPRDRTRSRMPSSA